MASRLLALWFFGFTLSLAGTAQSWKLESCCEGRIDSIIVAHELLFKDKITRGIARDFNYDLCSHFDNICSWINIKFDPSEELGLNFRTSIGQEFAQTYAESALEERVGVESLRVAKEVKKLRVASLEHESHRTDSRIIEEPDSVALSPNPSFRTELELVQRYAWLVEQEVRRMEKSHCLVGSDVLINGIPWLMKPVPPDSGLAFPQDHFLLNIRRGAGVRDVQFRTDPITYVRSVGGTRPQMSNYCTNSLQTSSVLANPGGNQFVIGDLCFVGHNFLNSGIQFDPDPTIDWKKGQMEAEKKDIAARLRLLGLSKITDNQDSIHQALRDSTGIGTLIWVGMENKQAVARKDGCFERIEYKDLVDRGWQPLYHIDLFFHPIKIEETDGRKEVYYMLGEPVLCEAQKFCKEDSKLIERLKVLAESLDSTESYVNRQLRDAGCVGKAVRIPMPFGKETCSDVPGVFTAYANGLMESRGDSLVYYMPKYLNRDFSKYFNQTKRTLRKHGVTVIPIEGVYGKDYALHCLTYVHSRLH